VLVQPFAGPGAIASFFSPRVTGLPCSRRRVRPPGGRWPRSRSCSRTGCAACGTGRERAVSRRGPAQRVSGLRLARVGDDVRGAVFAAFEAASLVRSRIRGAGSVPAAGVEQNSSPRPRSSGLPSGPARVRAGRRGGPWVRRPVPLSPSGSVPRHYQTAAEIAHVRTLRG